MAGNKRVRRRGVGRHSPPRRRCGKVKSAFVTTPGRHGGSLDTALLVIDMQRGLLDAGPWQGATVLAHIQQLVTRARASGAPIVFMQDRRVELDPALDRSLVPAPADGVIGKDFCDSFLGTPLEAWLKARAVRRLVVAGMQSDYCVDTSCRRAASLGYAVELVKDAHTTFDNGALTAEQIVAHHNQILRSFRAGSGSVRTVASADVQFA
jgi:nicotinamidase-related amidase